MATVTAKDGDTLCNLAIQAGFLNCQQLRDEPANSKLLNRPLQNGDVVTIPDVKVRQEDRGADTKNTFQKKNAPPVSIRFVHGSPDRKYLEDFPLFSLNISNYPTNRAGSKGLDKFPSQFEFHPEGHADPDTFKIEVVDAAAGDSVSVILEALKPVYKPDAKTVDHFEQFQSEPFANLRKIPALQCKKVRSGVAYRSKYLRLVVDELDKQAVPEQTLLVNDLADGSGTGKASDSDTIEILDQQVRASYVSPRCTAPSPNQCTVRAQLPVGVPRKCLPMAIHVFKAFEDDPANNVKAGDVVGGLTAQMIRRRVFRWFRRSYAQANIIPRLPDPIDFLVAPANNMLVISPDNGSPTAGLDGLGNPSKLSFLLATNPPSNSPADSISLTLAGGLTPDQVADAICKKLPPIYNCQHFTNPIALNAVFGSCDILITRKDGVRVEILAEFTNDDGMTVEVPRPFLTRLQASPSDEQIHRDTRFVGTSELRRVVREAPGTGDRVHLYVVDTLVDGDGNKSLRGIAFPDTSDVGPPFRGQQPMRRCAILDANIMDGGDGDPFTAPHEVGHVLMDAIHVRLRDPLNATQVMRAGIIIQETKEDITVEGGTSKQNGVGESKRFCDTPLTVQHEVLDPQGQSGSVTRIPISEVQRIFQRGAPLLQDC